MSQLTPHFADTEPGLTVLAGADSHVIENVTFLCEKVLEPIHDKFGAVHVHDSYRDPGHNAQVGGKTASFHLCIGGHAAVDVDAPAATSMQFSSIGCVSNASFPLTRSSLKLVCLFRLPTRPNCWSG